MARVGNILRLTRTKVEPKVESTYRQIGVYSWGKGIIENSPISGTELSQVTYFHLPVGALVLSNIQAWEAAIAVSDERHRDFIASQRFLPYVPVDDDEIDVKYACHYFLSDEGIAQIRRASPGSITRNRTLGIQAFQELQIPLPNIKQQREIANRLDSVFIASDAQQSQAQLTNQLTASIATGLFAGEFELIRLSDLLSEVSRFERIDPALKYRSAGVKWYAEGVFGREAKPASEIKATQLNRLVEGEFIYNRLFAWKGSFALTTDEPLHASNEFPTFEINRSLVLPEYLLGWFSHPKVWEEVERLSTGATPTSRNRLKQEQLLGMSVSLPPLAEQQRIVELLRELKRARRLNADRARIAKALPQATRNAEFARLMS